MNPKNPEALKTPLLIIGKKMRYVYLAGERLRTKVEKERGEERRKPTTSEKRPRTRRCAKNNKTHEGQPFKKEEDDGEKKQKDL